MKATPLVKAFVGLNSREFEEMMERRKTEVAAFIINSIKK